MAKHRLLILGSGRGLGSGDLRVVRSSPLLGSKLGGSLLEIVSLCHLPCPLKNK